MHSKSKSTGLFLCNRSRTLLMADIADHLKKSAAINCAYVYYMGDPLPYIETLSRFDNITSNLDVFSPDLSSFSDERIRFLETCYDESIFLWNAFYAERSLVQVEQDVHTPPRHYRANHAYSLIIKALHYADQTISSTRPDFVFDISPLGLHRFAFQAAANFYKVPFLLHYHSLIGERYTIYDDIFFTNNQIKKTYDKLTLANCGTQACGDGWAIIKKLQKNELIYASWKGAPSLSPSHTGSRKIHGILVNSPRYLAKKFRVLLGRAVMERRYKRRGLINYIDDRKRTTELLTHPLRFECRSYKNRQKIKSKLHTGLPENERKKKILYTWHYQPEASTSQLAPFNVNQEVVVNNIARVVPLDCIVIVKPHPASVGMLRPEVFDFIRRLPNVYFESPERLSTEIIADCSAIVTLTGTSGLEGMAFGKPTFYLGMPIWRTCNSAVYCPTYEDLGRKLRNLDDFRPDLNDLANYFQAIIDNSVDIPGGKKIITGPYRLELRKSYEAGVQAISQQLMSKIKQHNTTS